MNTLNTLESLNYVGQDRNGYVYLHHWATGWQQLVFPTHEDAARFLAARQLPADLPYLWPDNR